MFSSNALVTWFLANAAALPWRPANLRDSRDPYAVWISEIMLQQTQVAAVKEHFIKWMQRFPTLQALATASEEDVLRHWQGLGYYSRAKNIFKTAKILVENFGGNFPQDRKAIEALPGIGKYTAGAILSFGFHKPEAILDGNLIRVFSRLYKIDFLPTKSAEAARYWAIAKQFATGKNAYLQNEALMELGRSICKIQVPDCGKCPFKKECKARKENCIAQYPPKKDRACTSWFGIIAIIQNAEGKFYTSIGESKFLKSQRTFPHFETSAQIAEGIPAEIDAIIGNAKIASIHYGKPFKHSITHHKITMRPLFITLEKTFKTSPKNWLTASEAEALPSSLCQKALRQLLAFNK